MAAVIPADCQKREMHSQPISLVNRERIYEALNEKVKNLRILKTDLNLSTFCQVPISVALLAGTIAAAVFASVLWPVTPVIVSMFTVGAVAFIAWTFTTVGTCVSSHETNNYFEKQIAKKISSKAEIIKSDPKYIEFKQFMKDRVSDDKECMELFLRKRVWDYKGCLCCLFDDLPSPFTLFAKSMATAPFKPH